MLSSISFALDISGKWDIQSAYGSNAPYSMTMNLTQPVSGSSFFSGTYNAASGQASIRGTLQGNIWNGTFTDPQSNGFFIAYFSADGNSFNGKWDYLGAGIDRNNPLLWMGTWNGVRDIPIDIFSNGFSGNQQTSPPTQQPQTSEPLQPFQPSQSSDQSQSGGPILY